MKNKTISHKHSKKILAEMCKRVGVDAKDFDFDKDDWFRKHPWTKEEEDNFVLWLANYLTRNKIARKGKSLYEAQKIIGNYGWVIQD